MVELSKKLLSGLQNRLKVGNRKGVHLNAIPRNSKYKFDIARISNFDKNLSQRFVNSLLEKNNLNFNIRWKNSISKNNSLLDDDKVNLDKIAMSLENLINQTDVIKSEKGINTFGFGFPLLVRRDVNDNKLTVASIIIWSLNITRAKEFNSWVVKRSEESPIYINEVLINHLQGDSQITIDQIPSEMLENGLINKTDLIDLCVGIANSVNPKNSEKIRSTFVEKLENVKSISDKNYYEKHIISTSESMIEFAGLFSIFEVQKQNIIHDYGQLLKQKKKVKLETNQIDNNSFQSLSSIKTDPSQQGILNSLKSTRNILIQGPPGTGKSQTLTAILINALENNKKTIVVCEKQTALTVLHEALIERGLGENCVLIKDYIKDRKTVVDSVRNRVDRSSYKTKQINYSKKPLNRLIKTANSIINSINLNHKKLGEILFENFNWTDTVGKFLSELNINDEDYKLDLDKKRFSYDKDELNELIPILEEGQKFYDAYKPNKNKSFINSSKLIGNNPFSLQNKIKEDFINYFEEFQGPNSPIQVIRQKNKDNLDLFDLEKTNRFSYKFLSWFSKIKKETLSDQKKLYDACCSFAEKINNDSWSKKKINLESSKKIIENIEDLLKSQKAFFENETDLFMAEFNWFQYYNSLSENHKLILDTLKEKTNWKRAFVLYYLNSLLYNSASKDLLTEDYNYQEIEESLKNIEGQQLKYIKKYWHSKQINSTIKFDENPDLTVKNLYNKRSSRRHRRHSLRQIVNYNSDFFTTFFPIILTTPDVCCNLFQKKKKYFDIVLFDEASQLRLEDNLPAILKGKQIIIAGDEHQMPPSNYFSKILDGVIDDEDDFEEDEELEINKDEILLSCESLLDFAEDQNFEKRYLDFHYRSKHPYLIDFSNHAFYKKRLKPLPNKFNYTPINYIPVNGLYANNTNEQEAMAVLSILDHNIHKDSNGKYPSIGIATFNIAQRNLIISKIIERRLDDKFDEFNDKIIELEKAGLFVKNLENIQGDERDVIILSTTYGVNKDERFFQRFGPINYKKGYKLLNVIITRAKYKLYVCSSIPENYFLNFIDYILSGGNNGRGVFYAYLTYAKAVSEQNSKLRESVLTTLSQGIKNQIGSGEFDDEFEMPFENHVCHILYDNFDNNKIFPGYQFAGFKIDIVYDPKIEGIPKIAIECDGTENHLSDEAYLYDHYRQMILEDHGFIFHRIWSTNWWQNSEREVNNLINFIKDIESQKPKLNEGKYDLGLTYSDDFNASLITNLCQDEIEEEVVESINQ